MSYKLTASQSTFLQDLNATQAAIRAGHSKKTANAVCARLLVTVGIQAAIDKAREEQIKRTLVDADRVIKELALPAFLDPAGLFDDDGNPLNIHNMPEDVRRVIEGGRNRCWFNFWTP